MTISRRKIVMDAADRKATLPSRQLVEAFAKALQADRKADALLGRLEDDEGRGLAGAHLVNQLAFHDHFGDAAVGQEGKLIDQMRTGQTSTYIIFQTPEEGIGF